MPRQRLVRANTRLWDRVGKCPRRHLAPSHCRGDVPFFAPPRAWNSILVQVQLTRPKIDVNNRRAGGVPPRRGHWPRATVMFETRSRRRDKETGRRIGQEASCCSSPGGSAHPGGRSVCIARTPHPALDDGASSGAGARYALLTQGRIHCPRSFRRGDGDDASPAVDSKRTRSRRFPRWSRCT